MTKVRLLTLSVIGLLILNIAMVVGMVIANPSGPVENGDIGDPKGPRRKAPKEIFIERLEFDEGQVTQLEEAIKIHQGRVRPNDRELRKTKQDLYQTLNQEDQSGKDTMIRKIIDHIYQIETAHYDHFLDIKAICREDQLPAYRELTRDLPRIFAPKPPPKKK